MATASTTPPTEIDGDILYEVVDGEIVEIPPMGAYETWIASVLLQHLVGEKWGGRTVMEMLFDLTKQVGRKRRPDLAFVSFDRWPRSERVPRHEAWEVVPNLAVEVISSTNTADDVVDKLAEYFRAGVERVWVVYPSQWQIYVYSSPVDVQVLTDSDDLTDESMFPGFRFPLVTLFDDTIADE